MREELNRQIAELEAEELESADAAAKAEVAAKALAHARTALAELKSSKANTAFIAKRNQKTAPRRSNSRQNSPVAAAAAETPNTIREGLEQLTLNGRKEAPATQKAHATNKANPTSRLIQIVSSLAHPQSPVSRSKEEGAATAAAARAAAPQVPRSERSTTPPRSFGFRRQSKGTHAQAKLAKQIAQQRFAEQNEKLFRSKLLQRAPHVGGQVFKSKLLQGAPSTPEEVQRSGKLEKGSKQDELALRRKYQRQERGYKAYLKGVWKNGQMLREQQTVKRRAVQLLKRSRRAGAAKAGEAQQDKIKIPA